MPLYEYQCQKCNKISEFLLKISDPHPDSCPACSHPTMKKLLSRTNFVLKGTGWYETDFKKKDGKAGAPAAEKGDKEAASGTTAASETAPTASSEKSSESSEKTPAPPAAPATTTAPTSAPSADK
jgi:putative FmdB family regulatory protein